MSSSVWDQKSPHVAGRSAPDRAAAGFDLHKGGRRIDFIWKKLCQPWPKNNSTPILNLGQSPKTQLACGANFPHVIKAQEGPKRHRPRLIQWFGPNRRIPDIHFVGAFEHGSQKKQTFVWVVDFSTARLFHAFGWNTILEPSEKRDQRPCRVP
jgi:hypothetical protein